MTSKSTIYLASMATLALAIGGCGGAGKPATSPSPSSSPQASVTSPSSTTSQAASTPATAANNTFAQPIVPGKQQDTANGKPANDPAPAALQPIVAGLIPPSSSDKVAANNPRGRTDPFSALSDTPTIDPASLATNNNRTVVKIVNSTGNNTTAPRGADRSTTASTAGNNNTSKPANTNSTPTPVVIKPAAIPGSTPTTAGKPNGASNTANKPANTNSTPTRVVIKPAAIPGSTPTTAGKPNGASNTANKPTNRNRNSSPTPVTAGKPNSTNRVAAVPATTMRAPVVPTAARKPLAAAQPPAIAVRPNLPTAPKPSSPATVPTTARNSVPARMPALVPINPVSNAVARNNRPTITAPVPPTATPPKPEPTIARSIEVVGLAEIDGKTMAMIKLPNENFSRYVEVGTTINGTVTVKRIEHASGLHPIVIFEEVGVEVARKLGDRPNVAAAPGR